MGAVSWVPVYPMYSFFQLLQVTLKLNLVLVYSFLGLAVVVDSGLGQISELVVEVPDPAKYSKNYK